MANQNPGLKRCRHGMIEVTCAYCAPRQSAPRATGADRAANRSPRSRISSGGRKELGADRLDDYIQAARQRLIKVAKDRQLVAYSEIMNDFGGRGHIGKVLYEVCRFEHARGRPLLSAVVVQKQTGRPGEGFAALIKELFPSRDEKTAWEAELERVWAYWADHED